ncbi:MAG: hypothetical protein KJZ83_22685 [Burkholderiaceae bacterium]|nr:hypothetical protein [Burkholderiaceae bacterium]
MSRSTTRRERYVHDVLLLDSISALGARGAGRVVVTGSHGGRSAAAFVLDAPVAPRAVLFNDAGVGKDDAGIVALAMLEARGIAAAAYRHDSARIGDAADGANSGVLSHLNDSARALGLARGDRVAAAIAKLAEPAS